MEHMAQNKSWTICYQRCFTFVFSSTTKMIGMLGGLAYLLDIHGYLKDLLINNHWDQILSRHPIPIYCGIGVFAFFVLIIIQCWFMRDDMSEFRVEPSDYIKGSDYNLDCHLLVCLGFFVISGILSIMFVLFVATLVIRSFIQLMWEIHNHFLAKKELTKLRIFTAVTPLRNWIQSTWSA